MNKKNILLLLVITSVVFMMIYFYMNKHPLIGEWVSGKDDGVGLFPDPKAPYTVVFTDNAIKILDKSIAINYILDTKEKNVLYIEAKEDKDRLKIKQLENGKIQFFFPGVGLRQYQRK